MRLAFDADDVLYPYAPNVLKFYNQLNGTNFTMADFTDYHLDVMWGNSREEADSWVERFVYSDFSLNLPPIDGVYEALSRLQERHELNIITARWTPNRRRMTYYWLDQFLPGIFPVENIYFNSEMGICKSVLCRELGIDALIDGRYAYIERTAKIGINAILFQPDEYLWNRLPEILPDRVYRTRTWSDIENTIERLGATQF